MQEPFCSLQYLRDAERKGVLAYNEVFPSNVTYAKSVELRAWVVELSMSLKLSIKTMLVAINLLNAYLARSASVTLKTVRECVLACILMASKYHDVNAIEIDDVELLGLAVDLDDVLSYEKLVFSKLGCNIDIPVETNYLRAIAMFVDVELHECKLLLLILAVVGIDYLPSVVATATVKLVLAGGDYQNPFMIRGYSINHCYNDIIRLVRKNPVSSFAFAPTMPGYKELCYKFEYLDVEDVNRKPRKRNRKSYNFVRSLELPLVDTTNIHTGVFLGSGAYGSVHKVSYQGSLYAVKEIRSNSYDGLSSSFLREVSITMSLNNEYIVKPRHINLNLDSLFMDLANGDLNSWVGLRNEATQKVLAKQMFKALNYMYDAGCLHRDIKPANILTYPGPKFVLADFGLSRGTEIVYKDNSYTTFVVTLWYRPPELLLGATKYSFAVDVWSMGCALYEFALKKVLFKGDSEFDQIMKIFGGLGTPTNKQWPSVSQLPNYKAGLPNFRGDPDLFRDVRLCKLYREVIPLCLALNPDARIPPDELHERASI